MVDHADVEHMSSLTEGRCDLGKISPAGLFRCEARPARVDLQDWDREAPSRNQKLLKQVRSSGDIALDAAAWSKCEEEIKSGAVKGPCRVADIDLDSIALHPSFPVWERAAAGGWKPRNIENWMASGGSDTVEVDEVYSPHDLDVARAVIWFQKAWWGEDQILAGFTSDYKGAFRQSPLHPEQVPLMWSATWHPA